MAVNFTESELKLLTRAWLCVEGGLPKTDYEKLATVCNFSNKASASSMWSLAKKKLNALADGAGLDGDASPKKKTPRERAAPATNPDGTPKKRARKSKAELAEKNDDDEDTKTKVKEEDAAVDSLLAGAKEYLEKKGDENEDEV